MKVAALIVAVVIGLGLLGFFVAIVAWAARESGGTKRFLRELSIPLGLVAAAVACVALIVYATS